MSGDHLPQGQETQEHSIPSQEEQQEPKDERGLRERLREELQERCASIPLGMRMPLLFCMLAIYIALFIYMLS